MLTRWKKYGLSVLLVVVFMLPGGSKAQDEALPLDLSQYAGLDVVLVIENSVRASRPSTQGAGDPSDLRFDTISYVAQVLADNALFINPGATHTLSVVLTEEAGSVLFIDKFTFGPYDATEISLRLNEQQDALQSLEEELLNIPSETGGGGDFEWESTATNVVRAFDGVPSTSGRIQQVYLTMFAGPQSNLSNPIANLYAEYNVFMRGRELYALLLPSASNIRPSLSRWEERPPNLVAGNQYLISEVPQLTATLAPNLVDGLDRVLVIGGYPVTRITLPASPRTFEMPHFVSSATFVSYNSAFTLAPPAGAATLDIPMSDSAVSSRPTFAWKTLNSPPPGNYTLGNAETVEVWLQMANGNPMPLNSVAQVMTTTFAFDLKNVFGQVLHYSNVNPPPTIPATVTHEDGTVWELDLSGDASQYGSYQASFVPPLDGTYSITYAPDFSTSSIDANASRLNLLNNTQILEASRLVLAVNDNVALDFTLYQGEILAFSLANSNVAELPLAVPPRLSLTAADGMHLPELNLVFSEQETISVSDVVFERLPTEASTSLLATLTVTLADYPDIQGNTTYTLISEQPFPVEVSRPTFDVSASESNVILRSVALTASPTGNTPFTEATRDLFDLQVCAAIQHQGQTVERLPLINQGENFISNAFVPHTEGDYSFSLFISTSQDCQPQNSDVAIDMQASDARFKVTPLYLAFVDPQGAAYTPTLQHFLPLKTRLAFFTPGTDGNIVPYSGDLSEIPVLNTELSSMAILPYEAQSRSYQVDIAAPDTVSAQMVPLRWDSPAELRIYDGNQVLPNNQALSIAVTPATLTVDMQPEDRETLRQFATMRISMQLQSNDYSASDFNQAGGLVVGKLRLETAEGESLSWEVSLPYAGNDTYETVLPLPLGGIYTLEIALSKDGKEIYKQPTSEFETASVESLGLVARADNPPQVPAETQGSFSFEWQDSAGNVVPLAELPHLQQVTLTLLDAEDEVLSEEPLVPVGDVYTFLHTPPVGASGNRTLKLMWVSSSPESTTAENTYRGEADPFNFVVGEVTGVYVSLIPNPSQDYYTPVLPLVRPDIQTERELIYQVVFLPDADADAAPDQAATPLRLRNIFMEDVSQDNFRVALRDANNRCYQNVATAPNECLLNPDNWSLEGLNNQTLALRIKGIEDSVNYRLDVQMVTTPSLNLNNTDNIVYGMRNLGEPLQVGGVLQPSPLTFALPVIWGSLSLFITSLIYAGILLRRRIKAAAAPHMQGYLAIVDSLNMPIGWQEDLASYRRNRLELKTGARWQTAKIRRMIIRSVENDPQAAHVELWLLSNNRVLNFLLNQSPYRHLAPPLVKKVEINGNILQIPGTQYSLVLSDQAYTIKKTSTEGRRRGGTRQRGEDVALQTGSGAATPPPTPPSPPATPAAPVVPPPAPPATPSVASPMPTAPAQAPADSTPSVPPPPATIAGDKPSETSRSARGARRQRDFDDDLFASASDDQP